MCISFIRFRIIFFSAACHSGTEDGAGVLLVNTGLDLLTSNKRCTLFFFFFLLLSPAQTQHPKPSTPPQAPLQSLKNINTGLFTFSAPSTGSFPHVVGGGGGGGVHVQRTEYSFN